MHTGAAQVIVVRVELWSAVTGKQTELARMHICNDGTNANVRLGNYTGETFRGRSTEQLNRRTVSKAGHLVNFPRHQLHIWNLVARMLANMGYQ